MDAEAHLSQGGDDDEEDRHRKLHPLVRVTARRKK
jgi:hypothetical protein